MAAAQIERGGPKSPPHSPTVPVGELCGPCRSESIDNRVGPQAPSRLDGVVSGSVENPAGEWLIFGSLRSPGTPGCRAQTPVWQESPPVGYNAKMKLQFSLATLLVCIAVFAIVAGICASSPQRELFFLERHVGVLVGEPIPVRILPPNAREIFWRMAYWEPPILTVTLLLLWTFRRLKSRHHTEPPVG